MWDETSQDETSSGTKRPGMKHPYETEMVRNIQHPYHSVKYIVLLNKVIYAISCGLKSVR